MVNNRESTQSYEILEEGFERVFEAVDSLIAGNQEFQNKELFIDISLVDGLEYTGKQHVNIRERDEDVYKIVTPNKFHRRIHLYTPTEQDELADQVMISLKKMLDTVEAQKKETYFISPAPRTDKVDLPKRGDVHIAIHNSNAGWPITSFLVHQSGNISEQCKQGLEWIKRV